MRGNLSPETIELQKERLAVLNREGYISVEAAARIALCPSGTIHTWVRTKKLTDVRRQFGRVFVRVAQVYLAAGIKFHEGPHTRVGPGVDRAPCGVSGSQVSFSQTKNGIKCPTCRAFRENHKASAEQLAKMRRAGEARRAETREAIRQRRRNGAP